MKTITFVTQVFAFDIALIFEFTAFCYLTYDYSILWNVSYYNVVNFWDYNSPFFQSKK